MRGSLSLFLGSLSLFHLYELPLRTGDEQECLFYFTLETCVRETQTFFFASSKLLKMKIICEKKSVSFAIASKLFAVIAGFDNVLDRRPLSLLLFYAHIHLELPLPPLSQPFHKTRHHSTSHRKWYHEVDKCFRNGHFFPRQCQPLQDRKRQSCNRFSRRRW
jgi:hypothetical protein